MIFTENESGTEKLKQRAAEIYKARFSGSEAGKMVPSGKVEEFCRDFAELEMDFNFVKELNRVLSMKYDAVFQTFPTVKELENIILAIENGAFGYDDITKKRRLEKLRKFKSALVAIERDDPKIRAPRYDEVEGRK